MSKKEAVGYQLSAVSLLVLSSCASPLDPAEMIGPPAAELRQIDEVRFEELSRTDPVSVEEAAEDALEELREPVAPPPEQASVSLTDVRASALENNLDLQVELVSPSIAATLVDEEQARFEATFFATARHTKVDSPTELATESSQATIDEFNLGFRMPLRTGGNLTVDMPFGRSDTDNVFSLINPAFDTAARFSISQPLLRGAGIETNEYGIRVAQYERKIADAATRLEAIRILANADRAYWLLYAVRRELEVRIQEYELAVTQLEQAHRKVQAGDAAAIEVTRAESGVAERLEAIIRAETLVLQQQRDLKRIMNRDDLPLGSPTHLLPTTDPDPVQLDLDPIALGEAALANRMEMLELELRLAIDRSTIDLERNNALPLFTLDYTYSLNGLAGSLGRAYDQISERSFGNWSVGLTAEVPIGNEAARSRVHRAILTRVQRLATRKQRRLAILEEVYDALDRMDQDWQRILAARQAAILAGRTYEGEQRQFEVGLRTSTDVLDAAARLADAQSQEVRALADYQIAQVDLAFATGTLLGHDRVHWEPIDIEPPAAYFPRPSYGDEALEGTPAAGRRPPSE
jgi:outer membrane protein TolC